MCRVPKDLSSSSVKWAEAGKPSRGAESKLTKLMQFGADRSELRAEEAEDIARMAKADLGGDLKAVLNKWMLERRNSPVKVFAREKTCFRNFP